MRRFLVTGGAGFIGSHIAEALVRRGDEVVVLDNFSTGRRENLESIEGSVRLVEGDLTDPQATAEAVDGVDCVFHQAALASVPLSIERPLDTHRDCATGTLQLLHSAQQAGVRRLVYAASSSLYGDLPAASKRESDLPAPISPYAAAKYAGEMYCHAFYHAYGLETVALRYFNVFGPRQDPDSPYSAVIPLFITKLLNGEPPLVFGDGLQSRDFTYVTNVVDGNLLACDAADAAGESLNLANGRSCDLLQLIGALQRLLDVAIEPRHEPPRTGDIRESMADITRARAVLGYEPRIGLEEGLRMSVDYYRQLATGAR